MNHTAFNNEVVISKVVYEIHVQTLITVAYTYASVLGISYSVIMFFYSYSL